jgi:DNA-binding NarL/FixJ family response regulator
MVRVLIVDDFNRIHEAVVRGRSQCQAPIRIVAEAHCGRTAIVLAQVYHYDVVVLPAVLSDLDGREVLKQIKARSASAGALVYGVDSPEAALAARRAGADGYFPQNREPQELAMAIADVAAGQPYFPHGMLPRVTN